MKERLIDKNKKQKKPRDNLAADGSNLALIENGLRDNVGERASGKKFHNDLAIRLRVLKTSALCAQQ